MEFLPAQIIRQKRDGHEIPPAVLRKLILDFAQDKLDSYQMSAFLMATYFQGMTDQETRVLTQSIIDSGKSLKWDTSQGGRTQGACVDKHSTGGIGDKTSLIVGPIVAAAGLRVPMMAGRGLGHTGGTVDKLESIPGFKTQLTTEKFQNLVNQIGIAIVGQSEEMCPADKRLYALRDVTGTVESIPLICGSILSKKLSEGVSGLVLDVKYGSGAFFKSPEAASDLARALKRVGEGFGPKISTFVTNMDQPLGRFAGNALEIQECVEILQNKTCVQANGFDLYSDTRDLSIALAAEMLMLGGLFADLDSAVSLCVEILSSGKAFQKWTQLCTAQGGDFLKLPKALHSRTAKAPKSGYIHSFKTEDFGYLNIQLGAGRRKLTDAIEFTSGLEFHVKKGHPIQAGEPMVTVHGPALKTLEEVLPSCLNLIEISEHPPEASPLIHSIFR